MNEWSYKRATQFAPIFRELYRSEPDDKIISLLILNLLELESLGQVLQAKKQAWDEIAQALIERLESDELFCRLARLLETIRQYPDRPYRDYAAIVGCHKTTVQQSLNALKSGGFDFVNRFSESGSDGGRPEKLMSLMSKKPLNVSLR